MTKKQKEFFLAALLAMAAAILIEFWRAVFPFGTGYMKVRFEYEHGASPTAPESIPNLAPQTSPVSSPQLCPPSGRKPALQNFAARDAGCRSSVVTGKSESTGDQ